MNRKLTKSVLLIVILAFFVGGGILGYQWWLQKQEIPIPKFPEVKEAEQITSFETLKLEEGIIGKNEREIAFLQTGDIWLLSKDLKRKYKMIDIEEVITDFSFSPDGKMIYWLSKKGEIFKKDEQNGIKSLVAVEKDMKEEIQEGWGDFESFSYLKGKVTNFYLSPDGKYIAYETLEGYIGCCAGPPNIPVTWIRIMKSDGTEKVEIERPSGVWRERIFFDGWLPDSKKILFHFQAADEPTQGSPFFEIGLDGENPQIYTEIFKIFKKGVEVKGEDITPEDLELFTIMVVGTEPVYSPTGEKVAYIKEGNQIRLRDIKTKETKAILELENLPFGPASNILNWSRDGSLLLVRGINKIFVFDRKGDSIFERKLGEVMPDYPGIALIDSALLSDDNKYLGGVYKTIREKPEIIFFENIITEEKKEFTLPELEYPVKEKNIWLIYIYPQFFSKKGGFYFLRKLLEADTGELWVIDTNTWKNYKVADNISQIVRVP